MNPNGKKPKTLGMPFVSSNVLVIDDDEETRNLFSTVLTDAGYLVEAVENSKQAIKLCKKGLFGELKLENPNSVAAERTTSFRKRFVGIDSKFRFKVGALVIASENPTGISRGSVNYAE